MGTHTIGIIADTHDNRHTIRKAVDIFNKNEVGLVLHAGDLVSPFTVLDFKQLNCPMELVYGNNDGEKIGLHKAFSDLGNIAAGPRIITWNEKRILLMHEHDGLDAYKTSTSIDIVVYGHNHEASVGTGIPLVINPGEAGGWLSGKATVALLDTDRMQAEIVAL